MPSPRSTSRSRSGCAAAPTRRGRREGARATPSNTCADFQENLMANQPPTRATIRAIFIAMLIGSVLIALIATFLPSYVELDDETAMMMRIVFYAAAVLSVGQ